MISILEKFLFFFLVLFSIPFGGSPASFSNEPISRSFGKLSLGMTLAELNAKAKTQEIEVAAGLVKEERFFYVPSVSARRGIEGVYCLFYRDKLYQMAVQYNGNYTDEIQWKDFVFDHLKRYGKASIEKEAEIHLSDGLEKLAPFALKVIQMNGFLKLNHAMVWKDSSTSLGVFEGKVRLKGKKRFHGSPPNHPEKKQRVETHYIVIVGDNKMFEKIPKKETPEKEKQREGPFQM